MSHPTAPGYYWFRHKSDDEWMPVRLGDDGCFEFVGDRGSVRPDCLTGEWGEQITPPSQ
jgi:hypothetical protein